MKNSSGLRHTIKQLIEHRFFEQLVITIILLNSITLGAETYASAMEAFGSTLLLLDKIFLVFFVLELLLRIYTYRLTFFTGAWNWFDFSIVVFSLLPIFGNLSALRALRILRAFRLLTVVPIFRQVLTGITVAIKNSVPVAVVLGVMLYIYGVMSSKLFGVTDPTHFGDLDSALLTLFQIMTLDSWNSITRPLIEVHWWAGIYFAGFVIFAVFILLSIVIGIASDAMNSSNDRVSNEDVLKAINKLKS